MLRVNALEQTGRVLASRYGLRALPTFIVFDESGQMVFRQSGLPDVSAILHALAMDINEGGDE